MTLSEIYSEIQQRAGDNSLTSTSMRLWVNLAIKQIAARFPWQWNLATKSTDTTTNGTAEITLPTDFKKMFSVRVGDASTTTEPNATEYSFVSYDMKNVDTDGNYYYLNPTNGTYGLIPTPATTGLPVYLKYYKIPDDLTDNVNDVPPFPSNYHELCIFFALKKFWEISDDFNKAIFYDREFENMLEAMLEDNRRSTGQLSRMRDVRELMADNQPKTLNAVELGR